MHVNGKKKLHWDGSCHCITDVCQLPFVADFHTHGLTQEIGIELQRPLFAGKEYMRENIQLFTQVAYMILNGALDPNSEEPFKVENWNDCTFKLFKTKDCDGVDILRIIECDMSGRFPDDEDCDFQFCFQYEDMYELDKLIEEYCDGDDLEDLSEDD